MPKRKNKMSLTTLRNRSRRLIKALKQYDKKEKRLERKASRVAGRLMKLDSRLRKLGKKPVKFSIRNI